ncbi:MAG: hypothetical protein AAB630_00480 [Patescibacteria group bacterium]
MLLAPLTSTGLFARPAHAFESTSTSFEIHAGDIEMVVGSSTSASFVNQSAGGQLATGIITNAKQILSGILYWLFDWYVPRYDQIHYRWRNDDGSEAAATFAAVEDGILSGLAKSTIKRLRFEISNEGWTRGSAPTFRLEVAQTGTCSSGTYAAVPATATTEHWEMADSTNITDGAATTNVAGGLTDANASFTAGETKDTANTTGAITLTSENFTEIEYSVRATTNAVSGDTYCFRLTNAGSTTNFVYTRYTRATVAGYSATGTLESSTFDTGITDGAAYNSILWTGALNSGKVKLQIATSNSSSGPWNYAGPGVSCDTSTFYEPAAGTPSEIDLACASIQNKRYFRYKAILCSASDCSSSGSNTPQVDDVIVNWAP